MSENNSNKQQFLLGLFGGFSVIAVIGLIILGVVFVTAEKGDNGFVAGQTETGVNNNVATGGTVTPPPANIIKAAKPKVELFVMSHCPYGTQIEKGIVPAVRQLGNKIDFELKFVYYAMHGEVEVKEQLNQYCIQKEQNSKLLDYLDCFLVSGDGQSCLSQVKIDQKKLASCTQAADNQYNVSKNLADQSSWLSGRYPLFAIHQADNEKYGVAGSPTLIINGGEVSAARDGASLLAAICASFEDQPKECQANLSAQTPSPGFGTGTASAGTTATCN